MEKSCREGSAEGSIKNRKMVAESSQLLVAALENLSNEATPAATPDIGGIVEEKMGSIQKDMMQNFNEKLDNKFAIIFNSNAANNGEKEGLNNWFNYFRFLIY